MVPLECKHWILAAAVFTVSVTVLHAALPTSPDISAPTSFTGQLLIATPAMRASAFEHAVVLVAQHNKDGALGIVINRPLDKRPIASVLEALGADTGGVRDTVRIFLGGPISPEVAFALHDADYHLADTVDIDGRVALTPATEVLRDIGIRKGPVKSLIAFGYAGWGASQLDGEVGRGDWFSVPEDPSLVFDDDPSKVWTDAMARHRP